MIKKLISYLLSLAICTSAFGAASSDPSILIRNNGSDKGYVQTIDYTTGLTASTSSGVATVSASGVSGGGQWLTSANIGIGTTDNVGIGSLNPTAQLDIYSVPSDFGINFSGMPVNGGIDTNALAVMHMDGSNGATTFTDSASTPHAFSANGGAIISTGQNVFGGASGLFVRSTSSNIQSADSTDWYFGTGDFTIDLRIRFVSIPGDGDIVSQYQNGSNFWSLIYRNGAAALYFQCVFGGATKVDIHSSWSPSLNTWYHIAIVRNGSTGHFFIDGVDQSLITTTGFSTNDLGDNTGILTIGGSGNGAAYGYSDAYLDEVRISKGTARWTSNFTLPTSAYSATVTQPRIKFLDTGTAKFTIGYDGNDSSKFKISTTDISTTPRLVIDSSGNIGLGTTTPIAGLAVMNGNVGVGTWLPSNTLTIKGDIKMQAEGGNINNVNNDLSVQRTTNDTQLNLGYRTGPDAFMISSTFVTTGAYKPLLLATSDLERIRIDTTGNIGIGTTTTTVPFMVKSLGATSGYGLIISGVNRMNIGADTVDTNFQTGAGNNLKLASGTSTINLMNGATVGIGTTLGNNALTIMPNAASGNVGIGTWNARGFLELGAGKMIVDTTGTITQMNGVSMSINNNGYQGSQSAGVTITNQSATAGASLSVTGSAATNGFVNIKGSSSGSASADFVRILGGSTPTETIRFTTGNNVGIGTSTPNGRFVVSGGNVGIGTNLVGALINIGGACATQENVSLCVGKDGNGIACIGYCTGALGTCSACTCC